MRSFSNLQMFADLVADTLLDILESRDVDEHGLVIVHLSACLPGRAAQDERADRLAERSGQSAGGAQSF